MVTVFFSYSHKDEDLRNELEIHLSTLKRQGIIETWHDRRIIPGDNVDNEIDSNVENADIILLLVSPYFIASDYCYNVEMKRALERHNSGYACVIPIILHPCDWKNAPFGKLRATPTDGKPISKFPNLHDAFLIIANDIRDAVFKISKHKETEGNKSENVNEHPPIPEPIIVDKPRSSNLRLKKTFSDLEKKRFLNHAFGYFANFFESSLYELKKRNAGIDTEFKRIDANHFTAAVYLNGNLKGSCKIWISNDTHSSGEIRYSASQHSYDNSWNDALHVEDNGYMLGLKNLMGHFSGNYDRENILSQEGGAEFFWSKLIDTMQ